MWILLSLAVEIGVEMLAVIMLQIVIQEGAILRQSEMLRAITLHRAALLSLITKFMLIGINLLEKMLQKMSLRMSLLKLRCLCRLPI
jgi:hypothetical protein